MSDRLKSPFLPAHLLKNQPVSEAAIQALSTPWRELTFVGFDTETTGKYPVSAEICEIGAVKWRGGKVVDVFETLIRPTKPMGSEVIAIHGITNEMVEGAPRIHEKIGEFHDFVQGAIPVAHHAPFDLGFLCLEFEKAGLTPPDLPVICSSLLSRKLFPESENHRLQTLIGFFELEQGAAHRAHDDAKACLEVGLRCLEKLGEVPLESAMGHQGGPLFWSRFSMKAVEAIPEGAMLVDAIIQEKIVNMSYAKGSSPGQSRRVHPLGLVRSLDGDFVVAYAEKDQQSKRYFLDQILSVESMGS
jgi:DNA polymerase III subunit epsilon